MALAVLAVLAVIALAGCTTGALRGVGEGERAAVAPAELAAGASAQSAGDAALQSGTRMNVAAQPELSPNALAPVEPPSEPQMARTREEAIRQIREKADASGDDPPDIFAPLPAAGGRLTPEEQERMKAELKAAAERNRAAVSQDEAQRRASEARRLRQRAQSHYQDALKAIEN